MKKIFITLLTVSVICLNFLFGQTSSDANYISKIEILEQKISKVKALPKEEQKQYFAALSDVENRKNTLKSMLKTPAEKRDKAWEDSWTLNYSRASDKLDKISVK